MKKTPVEPTSRPASIIYTLSPDAQVAFARICNNAPALAIRASTLAELKASGLMGDDGQLTELGHAARHDDLRWYNEYLSMHS